VEAPVRIALGDGAVSWGHADPEGSFVLRGLVPGEATLSVEAPGFERLERPLTLQAGGVTALVLRLRPEPTAGSVAGTVRLDSGARLDSLHVELSAPGRAPRHAAVTWSEGDGALLGRFSLEAPAGPWTLRPVLEAHGLAATPPSLEVRAPVSGLHFDVHDLVPRADLVLRAVDRAGRRVPQARAWLRDAAGRPMFEGALPAEPVLRDHAVEHAFSWSVVAPGMRITSGDSTAFLPGEGGRVATAILEPGWGAVLALVERSGAPVPGLVLQLDGERTAPSDALGRVHVDRPSAPRTLRLEGEPWRLSEDNAQVDPRTGRFAAGDGGWRFGLVVERAR